MTQQPNSDSRALRDAFGAFMTGVAIVATREASGEPRGFTANSFTSVSLDPPLLLVCIGEKSASLPAFQNAPGFTVSVLTDEQQHAAEVFSRHTEDRFAQIEHIDSPQGRPVIRHAAAWFCCDKEQQVLAGDHTILIGRVRSFDSRDCGGLGYHRGGFFQRRV